MRKREWTPRGCEVRIDLRDPVYTRGRMVDFLPRKIYPHKTLVDDIPSGLTLN